LIAFDLKVVRDVVRIKWSTASEIQNDYFEIQRSRAGQDFETIATVNGAGDSNTVLNYSFTDESATEGSYYYRLKQVDFDGDFEIFDTKKIKLSQLSGSLTVYPNPVTNGSLKINLERVSSNDHTIFQIRNAQGTIVYQGASITDGFGSAHQQVDMSFDAGIYTLTVCSSDFKQTIKVWVK